MKLLIVVDQDFQGAGEEIIHYLKIKHEVLVVDLENPNLSEELDKCEKLKILLSNQNKMPDVLWENSKSRNWIILTENYNIPQKNLIEQDINFIILPPYPCVFLTTKNHMILDIAIDILTWCIQKLKIKERSLEALSKKENEVVNLLLQGLDDREISDKLFISDKTVRNHISNILQKVGLKNRTQLVLWALQQIGKIEQLS